MKKIILLCLLGIVLIFLLIFLTRSNSVVSPLSIPEDVNPLSPTPTIYAPKLSRDIVLKEQTYRISWFTVSDTSKLELIPNFDRQETSQSVQEKNSCRNFTNGGFYSKSNTPLGLFVVDGQRLGDVSKSSLFNGFFSVGPGGAVISSEIPSGDSPIQLQSGPLLLIDGDPRKLQLKTDEQARRTFVALDSNQLVLFGMVYKPDELYSGPLLEDLPLVLFEFSKLYAQNPNLEPRSSKLVTALNLDGGSASAFTNQEVLLGELTSVGSFFCLQ